MRNRVFRALRIAVLVSNIGNYLQVVGAQWLLVNAGHAAILVALVTTTDMLPDALFGLAAGVLDLCSESKAMYGRPNRYAWPLTGAYYFIRSAGNDSPVCDRQGNELRSGIAWVSMSATEGIVDKPSRHSVDETVDRLKNILQTKGLTLFALVDHSGEAERVGMKMPPTKLFIFGSPKAGTPLMLAAPSIAIDLPLKILVWQDPEGKAWVSYNSPAYLQQRHGVPQELLQNIAAVEALATKATE
jgi:uncharacterized protein (DUF302 family)